MIKHLLFFAMHKHYSRGYRSDAVYVHELCECTQKSRFDREIGAPRLNDFVLVGEVVHAGVAAMILDATMGLGNVRLEPEFRRELNVDGKAVTVVGHPDIVYVADDGTMYVIDVKFVRSRSGIPKEHHVEQVRLYEWLVRTGETTDADLAEARAKAGDIVPTLMYVVGETGEILFEEVGDARYEAGGVESLVRAWLRNEAAPRYEWECRYCPYANICPYRGKRRVDEEAEEL